MGKKNPEVCKVCSNPATKRGIHNTPICDSCDLKSEKLEDRIVIYGKRIDETEWRNVDEILLSGKSK